MHIIHLDRCKVALNAKRIARKTRKSAAKVAKGAIGALSQYGLTPKLRRTVGFFGPLERGSSEF